ncbi:DMT family transporter [Gephyromycinifex aptenodytis]|uniref:DMT family transporter n=1 Tax=Gephyromycinifex aptenodytis TaxID=2716227 RepID=UPI001445FB39|nr:DMT family transporter [Gephyromycinifex aptenodytis]
MSTSAKANVLLTLTAAIWGFAFVAQRLGAEHLGPFAFNGARFALGAASLLPLIWFFGRRSRGAAQRAGDAAPVAGWRAAALPGTLAGAVLYVASALQQAGLSWTTAGKASFITGLYIVIVPILGIALRHRTTRATWIGVALALAGLYLLSVTSDFTLAPGDGLVFISAFFWAGHILVIDAVSSRHDPLVLSVIQFTACSVFSVLTALAVESNPFAGVPQAILPIFYGGFFSVGVAYTLQVIAQRNAKPAHAAIILSSESVFGAIGGALLLAETMTGRGYAGCALMMAGILVSQRSSPTAAADLPLEAPLPSAPVDNRD